METNNASTVTSEQALMSQFHKYTDAGIAIIQIRTREAVRTATLLRKNLLADGSPYEEWDIVNGFRRFTKENFTEHQNKGDGIDSMTALMTPLNKLRDPASSVRANVEDIHFFVYVDIHPDISNNNYAIELLQQYAQILPSTNVVIVLITPDVSLDGVPVGTVLVADLRTPTIEELTALLRRIVTDAETPQNGEEPTFPRESGFTDEDYKRIALLGLGMTGSEFETHAAISIVEASIERSECLTVEHFVNGIGRGKTAIIRQSEILELMPTEDISDVGGMAHLKEWIERRANCYSEEARDFGIEPPKGCSLVGVPGTGKSLVAKAIASVLDVPLVRFDFARVFSKYVGDSESRVRAALKMVEEMAPCVLFVDEIDKGLGGSGNSTDSGTSSRVLGSFLTWLQEHKAPVFTMVTANRVNGLPPELFRRGRFDAVFSVGMPNPSERREVLEIHLRKRDRDIEDFDRVDIDRVIERSNNYVPAEIEAAVKDGLVLAFSRDEEFDMSHILEALEEMIPMSQSHREQIQQIIEWAANNATPVSAAEDRKPAPVPATARRIGNGRRVIRGE